MIMFVYHSPPFSYPHLLSDVGGFVDVVVIVIVLFVCESVFHRFRRDVHSFLFISFIWNMVWATLASLPRVHQTKERMNGAVIRLHLKFMYYINTYTSLVQDVYFSPFCIQRGDLLRFKWNSRFCWCWRWGCRCCYCCCFSHVLCVHTAYNIHFSKSIFTVRLYCYISAKINYWCILESLPLPSKWTIYIHRWIQ